MTASSHVSHHQTALEAVGDSEQQSSEQNYQLALHQRTILSPKIDHPDIDDHLSGIPAGSDPTGGTSGHGADC